MQALVPLWLVFFIGMSDGAKETDGVRFRVEVGEIGKPRTVLAEQHCAKSEWKFCKADLTRFTGKKVVIRLVADPGKTPSYDHACWGDVWIVEGALAADYAGGELPAGTIRRLNVGRMEPLRSGYILAGKDISPLNAKATGASFARSIRTCGGQSKTGFFSHPAYKPSIRKGPVFAEFEVDLRAPETAAFVCVGLFDKKGRYGKLGGLQDGTGRVVLGRLIVRGRPGQIESIDIERY